MSKNEVALEILKLCASDIIRKEKGKTSYPEVVKPLIDAYNAIYSGLEINDK